MNQVYFNKINLVADITAINKSKTQNKSTLDLDSSEGVAGASSLFKMNPKQTLTKSQLSLISPQIPSSKQDLQGFTKNDFLRA